MHEQSIVESNLTLSHKSAVKANARRILSIDLVVGDYTGVVDDAVSFYFGFLFKNTIAAGAKIRPIPKRLSSRSNMLRHSLCHAFRFSSDSSI